MKRCLYPFILLALACLALLSAAWRILELLAFVGCVFALVMIILCLWQGICGWVEGGLMILVASVVLVCFGAVLRERWRRYVSLRLKSSDLNEPAWLELNLPYSSLLKRWKRMVAVDEDCAALQQEERRISWGDTTWRNVMVQRLGGEDWVAFFEYDAVSPLSCFRIAKVFRQEGVQLPARRYWLGADGIAIYRSGLLAVYPASRMEVLKQSFPMLTDEATFGLWLEESLRMGEFDS